MGEQIRGLERRQTEARETDNAALRADLNRVERLARAQPGAGDGPPRTGSKAAGFVTPPADVRAVLRTDIIAYHSGLCKNIKVNFQFSFIYI